MKRFVAAVLGLYLLAAVITRVGEATGRLQRCGCLPECWCRRPGLSLFRWVTPRKRHHLPGPWIGTENDEIAQQITAAFANQDLDAFGALLADDARWGDDDAPNKCRSRADVLAAFHRLLGEGVAGSVTECQPGPAGVLCQLRIEWPDPADQSRGEALFHLYRVQDGQIIEIERHDDGPSARAALASN